MKATITNPKPGFQPVAQIVLTFRNKYPVQGFQCYRKGARV